jgi:hypothetical protein
MSEYHFDDKKPIAREIGELCARYQAMPLRPIITLEENGRVALLGCGHRAALLIQPRMDEMIRCRDCYAVGMLSAKWMIEGDCGSR